MFIPYFLMAFLYLVLAGLVVLETTLVNWQILPALPNLRWLVAHLVALGALVELVFGALPLVLAARTKQVRPRFDWRMWLVLNAGIFILVLGVIVMNFLLITTGGTLIFFAILLLAQKVVRSSRLQAKTTGAYGSRPFYLAALGFLLTGVLVGTGLWQGWSGPLRIAIPKEVHVHANLWGFTALVFAGLLLDLSPMLPAGQRPHKPVSLVIFWLMALGALGLVLGPWLNINWLQVAGLGLHTVGSVLLMRVVFGPIRRRWRQWQPGSWMLVLSYVWFFLPVVVAPLVVVQLGVGNEVAGSGGPILIFGWILQFSLAVIPYFLRKMALPHEMPSLGGSVLSAISLNAGSILYWISLFLTSYRGSLRGAAYLLWLAALLPVLIEIAQIFQSVQKKVWGESLPDGS